MAQTSLSTVSLGITSYWYKHHPRLAYEGAFVTQFIAPFHRLVINADVYRSWSVRNKAASDSGSAEAAPVLSHEEAKYLAIAIESAQTILLYLSTAARTENGRRTPQFEEPQYWKDGMPIYKPMEPDCDHAAHVRTAVDTVICVIIVFSAMFLCKLRAAVGGEGSASDCPSPSLTVITSTESDAMQPRGRHACQPYPELRVGLEGQSCTVQQVL